MNRIIITLLLLSQISFAQTIDRIEWNFPRNEELKTQNLISEYNQFDFSNIWTLTENKNVLGIIGEDHQRLKIKLTSVEKDPKNPNKYFVLGKSCVKGTVCNFSGIITLSEIKEVKDLHFGVDDEYADKGIKSQGTLIADYEFKENSEQRHSGIFKGKLHSKWFLNSENKIEYDNIEFISDGYLNNAFVISFLLIRIGLMILLKIDFDCKVCMVHIPYKPYMVCCVKIRRKFEFSKNVKDW